MKKPDNGGGRIIARKTKNIVMLAMDHSQARIERGHIFEKTLARRNAVHIGLQLCHIATGLRVAPLFVCIADNVAQISFRRQGEGIRSEEHTSELQPLMRTSYAVFCLKKKKYQIQFTQNQ